MNLLKETNEILKKYNKTLNDINWVGSTNNFVDVNEFIKIADVEYDSGYGAPEVAENLLIVGVDWWLERHEYDGSEWWEYKSIPIKPNNKFRLKALTIDQAEKLNFNVSCGWESLERINGKK